MLIPWLLALGCYGGAAHPSVIEDVQLIGVEASTPEAQPGESVSIAVHLADPKDREPDILAWSCTVLDPLDPVCQENQFGALRDWATVQTPTDGLLSANRTVPEELWELFDSGNVEPVTTHMWFLACPPGECPVLEAVRDHIEDGKGPATEEILADLSDPTGWMSELPFDGLNLGFKTFVLSDRAPDSRNNNPVVDPRFAGSEDTGFSLPRGSSKELGFYADDREGSRVYSYAYTTTGQFEDWLVKEDDEVIRRYLLAPASQRAGRAWVVFEDNNGGTIVERWDVDIE